jgi:hypothetical protein
MTGEVSIWPKCRHDEDRRNNLASCWFDFRSHGPGSSIWLSSRAGNLHGTTARTPGGGAGHKKTSQIEKFWRARVPGVLSHLSEHQSLRRNWHPRLSARGECARATKGVAGLRRASPSTSLDKSSGICSCKSAVRSREYNTVGTVRQSRPLTQGGLPLPMVALGAPFTAPEPHGAPSASAHP